MVQAGKFRVGCLIELRGRAEWLLQADSGQLSHRVAMPMSHLCYKVCLFLLPSNIPLTLHLPELGINFDHIQQKSLAALNPLKAPDQNIMDDADLAGPLFFGFCFGMFLLFVCPLSFRYYQTESNLSYRADDPSLAISTVSAF